MRSRGALLGSVLLLPGCATVSGWFGGAGQEQPRAELPRIENEVRLDTAWRVDGGDGTGGNDINLVSAVTSDRVYVADHEGRVSAFDRESGERVWRVSTKTPISAGPGLDRDGGAILVAASDGEVLALSTEEGSILWRASATSEVLGVPQASLGVALVQSVDGNLMGLAATSGESLWVFGQNVPVLTLRGTSSPQIDGAEAITGLANGRLAAFDLSSGRLLWEAEIADPRGRSELERMVDVDADPLVIGGLVFAVAYQGNVAAVERSSGNVLWRRELSSNTGLTNDSRKLYVTDDKGQVWALDPRNGATFWKQDALRLRWLTAPAVFGGYIAVGDDEGYLHLLSPDDGALVGRVKIDGDGIAARPVADGETLFVYGNSGVLAALRLNEY
jgi:outer membrane protein assembly factor BamB